ncbi:MAG TPA: acyltransferase [Rhodanobacteraceae bacterium]|nr:acyltransferase [Rhodanobacteraceae bacterium]
MRAIAAFLVLWVHVSGSFLRLGTSGVWVHDLTGSINMGRIGVVMFFAISGFVVPFSIKLTHPHPIREFLITRFFRLYPAYWLSIPLGIFANWLWSRPFTWPMLAVNLTMLEYIFDVDPIIGLYWTLAVEFVFYVCCALLVAIHSIANYRRIGLLVVLLLATHAAIVAGSWSRVGGAHYIFSEWFVNLAVMFWGTLYRADSEDAGLERPMRILMWSVAFFIVAVYPLAFRFLIGVPLSFTIGYSIGVLLFIVGTRFLRIRFAPLAWLGLVSYSIYLLHPVVLAVALRGLMALPRDSWWRTWHLGAYVVLVAIATSVVAAIVYYRVEKPFIALGRRLARRLFERSDAAPQSVSSVA